MTDEQRRGVKGKGSIAVLSTSEPLRSIHSEHSSRMRKSEKRQVENTNRGSVVVLCRLYQLGDRGSIPGRTSTQGLKINE